MPLRDLARRGLRVSPRRKCREVRCIAVSGRTGNRCGNCVAAHKGEDLCWAHKRQGNPTVKESRASLLLRQGEPAFDIAKDLFLNSEDRIFNRLCNNPAFAGQRVGLVWNHFQQIVEEYALYLVMLYPSSTSPTLALNNANIDGFGILMKRTRQRTSKGKRERITGLELDLCAKRGFGRKIIALAEAAVRREGLRHLLLEAVSQPLRNLYTERYKFKLFYVKKKPSRNSVDSYIMYKDLDEDQAV